jgi:hypothetical protein
MYSELVREPFVLSPNGGYRGRVLGVATPLWMLNKLKILLKIEFFCVNK